MGGVEEGAPQGMEHQGRSTAEGAPLFQGDIASPEVLGRGEVAFIEFDEKEEKMPLECREPADGLDHLLIDGFPNSRYRDEYLRLLRRQIGGETFGR